MRGLFVVSTGAGGDELLVADALPDADAFVAAAAGPDARRTLDRLRGADAGDRSYEVAAVPAVAAGHAGRSIDPAGLVTAARAVDGDFVLVTAGGGLLAPLTSRYAVRDLAVELGLPVVIAAPAGPDMLNDARLSAEAARAAGLAVAGVVITRWPAPPSRVQLDERALLAELAGCSVVAIGETWPIAAWLETTPPKPAAEAAPAAVALDPYTAWDPRPIGDPRATPRPQIMAAMLEIIAAEGPMTATRAYSLYNKASGGKKLTSVARAPLSSAIYWLAQERKVVLTRRDEIPWQDDDLVRLPDSPAVRVRELGPRALDEVPLDEIAALIGRLRGVRSLDGEMEVKRAVLSAYGLVRLTSRADEYLGLALDLAS
jgi:AAA domain